MQVRVRIFTFEGIKQIQSKTKYAIFGRTNVVLVFHKVCACACTGLLDEPDEGLLRLVESANGGLGQVMVS
jgi:hypothetical protein